MRRLHESSVSSIGTDAKQGSSTASSLRTFSRPWDAVSKKAKFGGREGGFYFFINVTEVFQRNILDHPTYWLIDLFLYYLAPKIGYVDMQYLSEKGNLIIGVKPFSYCSQSDLRVVYGWTLFK